jgi:hypothetical protein
MAMFIYFLIRSRYFEDRTYSALAAAACGLGLMMKDTLAAYMLGIVAYCAVLALIRLLKKDSDPVKNLAVFSAVTLLIIYPYYIRGLSNIASRPLEASTYKVWFSEYVFKFFTIGLWEYQLGLVFFLLLIAGSVFSFKKFKPRFRIVLLLWIALPNLIFLVMPHWKTTRYLLPVLPAFALISAVGIREMARWKTARYFIAAAAALGLCQVFIIAWRPEILSGMKFGPFRCFNGYDRMIYEMERPQKREEILERNRKMREVREFIERKAAQAGIETARREATLLVLPVEFDMYYMDMDMNFNTYLWFRGSGVKVIEGAGWINSEECLRKLDLLGLFSAAPRKNMLKDEKYLKRFQAEHGVSSGFMTALAGKFSVYDSIKLDDNTYFCVFSKRKYR